MNYAVNVVSGLIAVGKSHVFDQLRQRPECSDAFFSRLDDVGVNHWGERAMTMTRTEKVFRNEIARNEIKEALIINGVKAVFVEMVMLTRKNHQEPFVEMVRDAWRYLALIEPERAQLNGEQLPLAQPRVNLNVVLLYCNYARVCERMARRSREPNTTNTPILTMDGLLDAAIQFEMPEETYTPLPIDTSDESPEAEEKRFQEITAFFSGQWPDPHTIAERMREAKYHLEELQAVARSAGITH